MSNELILLMHPIFGVLAIIAAVWVFVETLNVSESNVGRIRTASMISAGAIWVTYIVAGYWYVSFYGGDKALIVNGPWPIAHSLVMETKEHVFLMLLILATFLPIAARDKLVSVKGAKNLVLWTSSLVVLTSLAMEGAGAFISMGVKVPLLAKNV